MATDRAAVLSIRAQLRGIVDFRQARPDDVNWWQRLRILLDAMNRADEIEFLRDSLHRQLALLANARLEATDFKAVQETARDILNDLFSARWPWAGKSLGSGEEAKATELVSLYKQHVGDPNDPAVYARMQADLAKQHAAPVADSLDDVIEQRIKARDARRAARRK